MNQPSSVQRSGGGGGGLPPPSFWLRPGVAAPGQPLAPCWGGRRAGRYAWARGGAWAARGGVARGGAPARPWELRKRSHLHLDALHEIHVEDNKIAYYLSTCLTAGMYWTLLTKSTCPHPGCLSALRCKLHGQMAEYGSPNSKFTTSRSPRPLVPRVAARKSQARSQLSTY